MLRGETCTVNLNERVCVDIWGDHVVTVLQEPPAYAKQVIEKKQCTDRDVDKPDIPARKDCVCALMRVKTANYETMKEFLVV